MCSSAFHMVRSQAMSSSLLAEPAPCGEDDLSEIALVGVEGRTSITTHGYVDHYVVFDSMTALRGGSAGPRPDSNLANLRTASIVRS